MGSTYSVVVYGSDEARLRAAVEDASEEARRLDQLLSNYIPASEWSQVNREASSKPVRISTELFQLLAACVEYSRESDGAFDITVGPLMKVWGFYKGTGHLPHRAEVRGGDGDMWAIRIFCSIRRPTRCGSRKKGSRWTPAGSAKATR